MFACMRVCVSVHVSVNVYVDVFMCMCYMYLFEMNAIIFLSFQILHFVLLRDTGSATHDTSSLIQDICFPLNGTNWVKLSPVSYTCILCGMLAMLDATDLLEKCCHDNTCVLLTCIADKLFENIHRYLVIIILIQNFMMLLCDYCTLLGCHLSRMLSKG